MRLHLAILILLVSAMPVSAQVKVYNIQTAQIQFPIKAFRSGNNILVAHGINFSDDFAMAVIDTNGAIINNFVYGNQTEMEEPVMARQQSNGDIIITGLNFWDSSLNANIGNYKGFATVVDSFGQFKRSFRVKDATTYLNETFNAVYLDNHYYFCGAHVDSSEINPPIVRLSLCKTDTFGNVEWFKTYPQFNTGVLSGEIALEYTYDGQHILIGCGLIDSVVGNLNYYSHFMIRLDTAGNYINRIHIPKFAMNITNPGFNGVSQITRIANNKYLVCSGIQYNELDANFNILDSCEISQYLYNAKFANQSLYDQSFVIGGYKAFGKIYNSNEVFARDFANLPQIVTLKDVIPTYDGGYFALGLQFGFSSYIKMDCDGNYANPIWCWPVGTQDIQAKQVTINHYRSQLTISQDTYPFMNIRLYDLQGRIIDTYYAKRGTTRFELPQVAKGVYIVSASHNHQVVTSHKIFIE